MVTVGGWYSCGCTRFLNFRISATPFVITTRYEVEGKERFFFFFHLFFFLFVSTKCFRWQNFGDDLITVG